MMGLRDKAVTECQRAVQIDPNIQLGKNNLNQVETRQNSSRLIQELS
jgi:hypothetical protein